MRLLEFFLRKNGLYKTVINNIYEEGLRFNPSFTMSDAYYRLSQSDSITSLFAWSETKQGREFWFYKNKEFNRLIDKFILYRYK